MRKITKGYYRHFKGREYCVLSIAEHTETHEKMVVYQALYYPFKVYVRPYEMFASKVDKGKYPDVEQEYRFEKLESPRGKRSLIAGIVDEAWLEKGNLVFDIASQEDRPVKVVMEPEWQTKVEGDSMVFEKKGVGLGYE